MASSYLTAIKCLVHSQNVIGQPNVSCLFSVHDTLATLPSNCFLATSATDSMLHVFLFLHEAKEFELLKSLISAFCKMSTEILLLRGRWSSQNWRLQISLTHFYLLHLYLHLHPPILIFLLILILLWSPLISHSMFPHFIQFDRFLSIFIQFVQFYPI